MGADPVLTAECGPGGDGRTRGCSECPGVAPMPQVGWSLLVGASSALKASGEACETSSSLPCCSDAPHPACIQAQGRSRESSASHSRDRDAGSWQRAGSPELASSVRLAPIASMLLFRAPGRGPVYPRARRVLWMVPQLFFDLKTCH